MTIPEIQNKISAVMAEYPELGRYGLNRGEPGKFDLDSIQGGIDWIDALELAPTSRAFTWRSSYGLKHLYEEWSSRDGAKRRYMANGDFIVAMILSGIRVRRIRPGSPNVFGAMSRRGLNTYHREILRWYGRRRADWLTAG